MKKIYIYSPDVFEKDSFELSKRIKELCKKYNFEALSLDDSKIDKQQPKQVIANEMHLANKELIESSDIVLANLNSFRGTECHSGAAWVCGYAHALNKKIYGYLFRGTTYLQQFKDDEILGTKNGYTDLNGRQIEDFDYPTNHMIACSLEKIIMGNMEDALKDISSL